MARRVVMIMAGGTGGHVMPGLAIADEMRRRSWEVVWLGNPGGMEADLVPRHGIAMQWVNVNGLRGKGLLTKLLLPLMLMRAFWQSIVALRKTRPAVVLGMGGYVAFPGGMMASLLNHPLVIHEQNSVAGLTNRVLAKLADRVLQAFPGVLVGAQLTGNPLRDNILAQDDPAQRLSARSGPLNVLVVGGSLGASALNDVVPAALQLLEPAQRPVITHQSGRAHVASLRDTYERAGMRAHVVDFIEDIAGAYRWADLVVCRAGAMTIAELAAAGVASILVPYPYAVDDHQTTNAGYLSDADAAIRIAQHELTPRWLADQFASLSRTQLARMAAAARALAMPCATRDVADICEQVAVVTGAQA